ncbi:YceI family protein [Geothrix sp. 21YS21S-2]|uniref:YceI family protein n=1 Tax=Geothrix sp. 21YS21S-2 TaxID=3068893 RepID=UPI0027BAFEEC|nr:YceI family protein [Geothrix sp. 21YS21S-2]
MRFHLVQLAVLAISFLPLGAQITYKVDQAHSEVGFRVRHLVTRVSGRFHGFDGRILLDEKDLAQSSVTFTIQAATLDTALEARDKHLKGPDFFDVDHFGQITFQSAQVLDRGQGRLDVTGDLTIRGITKRVTIMAVSLGTVQTPFKDTRAGFEGQLKVSRKDYGMTWNLPLGLGGTVLGDEVDITLALEVIKQ